MINKLIDKRLIIEVNPEQSKIVQELLFKEGFGWHGGEAKKVAYPHYTLLGLNFRSIGELTGSQSRGYVHRGVESLSFANFIATYFPDYYIEQAKAAVAEAQAKLEALVAEKEEAERKAQKVELKGGDWTVGASEPFQRASNPAYSVFGFERQTKALAESARKETIRFQRMLAYVDEHGGHKEFVYGDENYTVILNDGVWAKEYFYSTQILTVWMSEEVATKLCEDLNSGRFSLDLPEA